MTALRISIILVVLLLIGSFFFMSALNNMSDKIIAQIDQVEQSVQQDQWSEAQKQMDDLEESWKKTEKWMTTLIDHHEIDTIEMTLSKASQYVHFRKNADFMAESAVLRHLIEHIPDMEKINISNLL